MKNVCFGWPWRCVAVEGSSLRGRPVDLQWERSRKWDNYNAKHFSITLSLRMASLSFSLHKHFIALWSLPTAFFPPSSLCCCLLVSPPLSLPFLVFLSRYVCVSISLLTRDQPGGWMSRTLCCLSPRDNPIKLRNLIMDYLTCSHTHIHTQTYIHACTSKCTHRFTAHLRAQTHTQHTKNAGALR